MENGLREVLGLFMGESNDKAKDDSSNHEFGDTIISHDIDDFSEYDPTDALIDVVLTTQSGKNWYAEFVTPIYVDKMFDKNKRTGENANGTYFATPNMIILEEITDKSIKETVRNIVKEGQLKTYFGEDIL